MKKGIKKYKDLIIVLVILVAVIGGTYLLSKSAENKNFKEISYEKYEELRKKDKDLIVYFASSNDEEKLTTLKEFAKDNNLSFNYILDENLTEEQKENINYSGDMIVYSSKEKEEQYVGELDETSLTDFFVDLEVLKKSYITIVIDEYVEMIKGENIVVFIAREGCGYCDQFKPVVNEVVVNNNVKIYQLDTTNFTQEDYEKLYTTASYFTEEQWGTPTTLIFNKGEVVDVLGGYVEASRLEQFLKTNGVI